MAKIYGNLNAAQGENPPGNANQGLKVTRWSNVIDLAKQAAITTADTIVVAKVPKGSAFRGGQTVVDTSLGTSTVAVGTAATPGKYKAAATLATVNTPVVFGAASAGAFDPLAADEEIILTIAVAPLPAAGKIYVDLDFLTP